jgi:predicted HAD superfamily Cof-like phosphohydrolase
MGEEEEKRYGIVVFDPNSPEGKFDWYSGGGMRLEDAERVIRTWDRVSGADGHRVYAIGIAPWRGFDVELDEADMEAACVWAERPRLMLSGKLKTLREQVHEFHVAMGAPNGTTPSVPSDERVWLRLSLISEEFFELLEAAGISLSTTQGMQSLLRMAIPYGLKVDLPAFVDAMADLDYVVEGTRLEFGVDGAPIAAAVHAANMAKAGGPVREDGKRLKPPGWTPPDIEGELRKQGWTEAPRG